MLGFRWYSSAASISRTSVDSDGQEGSTITMHSGTLANWCLLVIALQSVFGNCCISRCSSNNSWFVHMIFWDAPRYSLQELHSAHFFVCPGDATHYNSCHSLCLWKIEVNRGSSIWCVHIWGTFDLAACLPICGVWCQSGDSTRAEKSPRRTR